MQFALRTFASHIRKCVCVFFSPKSICMSKVWKYIGSTAGIVEKYGYIFVPQLVIVEKYENILVPQLVCIEKYGNILVPQLVFPDNMKMY